jgi:Na+-driven multidrug efflux pump/anti-sigma regulatory factor (Ser/Thr protein kinase)
MSKKSGNAKMISRLMLHLLPVQIMFALIGSVNAIVSSYFATNYIGIDAMTAVGLYAPLNQLISALSSVFVGGAAIICGKYIGQNDRDEVKAIFTGDITITALLSIVISLVLVAIGTTPMVYMFTQDENVIPFFGRYLLGQAIGIIPFIVGNQLTVFLSLENRQRLSVVASVTFIFANLFFNYLFVQVLRMEAFGLSLASSLGMWVFCLVEALYFMSGKSYIGFAISAFNIKKTFKVFTKGLPSGLSYIYQAGRGLIVNALLAAYVGSAGISAFGTANNFMGLFWAIPGGMLAVSRLLISIGMGEEDKHTLTEIMKVMLTKYMLIQCAVSAGIIAFAVPFTNIFYHDPAQPVYLMTVWGFRILPLCMPFSILCMHFTCYAQASGKNVLINILAIVDGVIGVAAGASFLIGSIGMNAIYIANVINGILTTIIIFLYAVVNIRRIPRNLVDLMVFPEDFGVPDDHVLELSVHEMDEVAGISEKVQEFCERKGIDHRRSMIAGLSLEEMAGNVVAHGFTKDKKNHSVDIKTVTKDDTLILRIKDDCVAFDPATRNNIDDADDVTKNIGIRMVYKLAKDVTYQNVLGLNVLTLKL